MMPSIQYISGNENLLDLIAPLWEKLNEHHIAISTYFSNAFSKFSFQRRKTGLLRKTQDKDIRIDIAKDNDTDQIIGYCLNTIIQNDFGKKVGEIESIYIEPDYRNTGIGAELVKKALDWMDNEGVHNKILGVAVGNERVFSFYQRLGFFPKSTKLEQILNENCIIEN